MKEPFVIVKERYINNPTSLAVDSSCSIGGVLYSNKLNKDLEYYKGGVYLISGPKQFRDAFCGGKDPISTDDSMLINAYYMSFFASLVIAPAESESALADAVDVLADNEVYPFRYVATFGNDSTTLLNALAGVVTNPADSQDDASALAGFDASYSGKIWNHWFSAFDIDSKDKAANYASNHNIILLKKVEENRNGFLLDSSKNDATVKIAASTLYWERVMINRSQNNEFAPVFGKQYGQLNYTKPDDIVGRKDREDLLDANINCSKYDLRAGIYYLNDNWTAAAGSGSDKATEAYAEENEVRFAHSISNAIQDILEQFKGRQNSAKTRKDVTDMLNLYFDNYVMTQGFPPEEYLVICDETNNDDAVVRGRKLCVETKVRLYNSIKYITVVNSIYVSGGAEFTE